MAGIKIDYTLGLLIINYAKKKKKKHNMRKLVWGIPPLTPFNILNPNSNTPK